MRHRVNACCSLCDELRRLLMPVRIHVMYGGPDGDLLWLCLECRLGWRDDRWACLDDTWRHLPAVRAELAA